MIVCVCSPLMYIIFRYTKIFSVLLLAICYITGVFIPFSGFSVMAFLFFGFGSYCRMNSIDTTKLTYDYRIVIYVVTFILWVVCTMLNGHNTELGDIVYPFYVMLGVMATINLATYLVVNKVIGMPEFLSKASFFVYLLHTIMVNSLVAIILHKLFGETNVILMLLCYLLVPIITILICLTVYYLLNRYSQSFCKLLTGNR